MTYNEELARSILIKNVSIEAVTSGDVTKMFAAHRMFLTDSLAADLTFSEFVSCINDIIKRRKEN